MWWTSRSEKSCAFCSLKLAVNEDGAVRIAGVWQSAHPAVQKARLPLVIEDAPPGLVVEAVGGARRRMNIANCTVSLGTWAFCAVGSEFASTVKLEVSSGVWFSLQLAERPPCAASAGLGRSLGNSSLVTPISTLEAL